MNVFVVAYGVLLVLIGIAVVSFLINCFFEILLSERYQYWNVEFNPEKKCFMISGRLWIFQTWACYRQFKTRNEALAHAASEIRDKLQAKKDKEAAKTRAIAEGVTKVDSGAVENSFRVNEDVEQLARLAAKYNFPLPKINLAE